MSQAGFLVKGGEKQMAEINRKDILGYYYHQSLFCPDCLKGEIGELDGKNEDWTDLLHKNDYLTKKDLEQEKVYLCDGCGQGIG